MITLKNEPDDSFVWAGTSTGDVVLVNLQSLKMSGYGPTEMFARGVTSLALINVPDGAVAEPGEVAPPKGVVFVGAGDGTVARMSKKTFKVIK